LLQHCYLPCRRSACEVNPNVLHRWRRELQDYGARAFAGNGQRRAEEGRIAELERKVGRQALEIDFLAAMLAACRGTAEAAGVVYPRLVYPYLEKQMSLATPIPLQRLCRLAGVSRAGYYRWLEAPPAVDPIWTYATRSNGSRWNPRATDGRGSPPS
jgi:transposase-like protein